MDMQENLLVTFSEELNEVATEVLILQKQVHKALRFGVDEKRDLPLTNHERIEEEWQDLLGAIQKLRKHGFELKPNLEAINKKMERIDKYIEYSSELGTIAKA